MSIADTSIWAAATGFSAIRRALYKTTGVRLKGLGFLLRRLRNGHVFSALGFKWFVDPRIADAYASVMGGSWLEPETHAFLELVADAAPDGFAFVDVGANVGEMVVTMAAHRNCSQVVAFEPHPACVHTIRQNLRLNGLTNVVVRPVLVSDGTPQPYVIDESASPNSGIRHGAEGVELTPSVRLDEELGDVENSVLLIDVEGAELEVMRSGKTFIQRSRPVIIFEYHADTRKRFSLREVQEVIGPEYRVFRLRSDGRLDESFEETWNCVAVHPQSAFWEAVQSGIVA